MNKFFSKLDLRDIKIDPEGSRFPPDADESEQESAPATAQQEDQSAASVIDDDMQAESPSFSPLNGHYGAPSTNGHLPEEPLGETAPIEETVAVATTVYEVDGEIVGVAGEVLKVSARSRPSAVAGAIAGVVREVGRAEVQAIGAGATNQAVKAVAIARDYLRETGIEAVCVPAFIDVTIDNEDRTAIRLVVEPR
jgi:stage V sporulation protein S